MPPKRRRRRGGNKTGQQAAGTENVPVSVWHPPWPSHPDYARVLEVHMGKRKREFTIDPGGRLERTIVGVTGQVHVLEANGPGKDGHFQYRQEGEYRRAMGKAVEENSR